MTKKIRTHTRRTWTLIHPNSRLDIDASNCLHLYKTKKQAKQEATEFTEVPKPARVTITVEEEV